MNYSQIHNWSQYLFLNSRYKYISLISICLTGTSTQHSPRWIHTLSSWFPLQRKMKMQHMETYGFSESSAQRESNSWKLKEKKDLKSFTYICCDLRQLRKSQLAYRMGLTHGLNTASENWTRKGTATLQKSFPPWPSFG